MTSIYARMHVLKERRAGPDQRDVVCISDLAVILFFATPGTEGATPLLELRNE